MTAPVQDPFAGGDSAPSISWKGAEIGTVVTLEVTDYPIQTQGKDFKTKLPATWPDGNPKLVAGIPGTVNGEPRMLWANVPSALFGAIKDAIKASGEKGPIKPGDTLSVKFYDTKPTDGDPQKLFQAKLVRGTPPPSGGDPFGDSTGSAAPAGDDSAPPW